MTDVPAERNNEVRQRRVGERNAVNRQCWTNQRHKNGQETSTVHSDSVIAKFRWANVRAEKIEWCFEWAKTSNKNVKFKCFLSCHLS